MSNCHFGKKFHFEQLKKRCNVCKFDKECHLKQLKKRCNVYNWIKQMKLQAIIPSSGADSRQSKTPSTSELNSREECSAGCLHCP